MSVSSVFSINGRRIGKNESPYIIGELSGNHLGDLDRALALLEVIAQSGADAAKLQTYTADTITINHTGPEFQIEEGPWAGRTLHELYDESHTPWKWHPKLFAKAKDLGITLFSSPFDATAVEFLEKLKVPAYKIASFEIIDLPLIECIASTGKPLIMSTGLATFDEIGEAIEMARSTGCKELALLHCISGYPTPPEEANLAVIKTLEDKFKVVVGLSDHTLGTVVAVSAIASGAVIIEKHVALNRSDGGPDAGFSLEPDEFSEMTRSCHTAYKAVGQPQSNRTQSEIGNLIFRRSLYVVKSIEAGKVFSKENLRSIRPGYGLEPKYLPTVIGRRAVRNLTRGTPLSWDDIENVSE